MFTDLRPRQPAGSTRPLRGRFAIFNECVREIADRHGATVVDIWRMRDYRDRRRGTPTGCTSARPATSTWRSPSSTPSASPHDLDAAAVGPRRRRSGRRETWAAERAWTREFLGPWVHRRLTGRSSGDSVSPEATRPGPSVRPPGSGSPVQ